MLEMRRFVKGVDEPIWVEVINKARQDLEDWRAITVEEFLMEENHPSFDSEGRFLAELDGQPVGIVHAHVDELRSDGKGSIRFSVIPESRGGRVERALVETAVKELKARNRTTTQVWLSSAQADCGKFLEELDFKPVRAFSLMEIDLAEASRNIGENNQVIIRRLEKSLEEDIRLLNWLANEGFAGHYDYRPRTVEETRSNLLSHPYLGEQEVFFALLNGESAGYVGVAIDEKYNLEKRVKMGEVFALAVLKPYRGTGIGSRLMLHGLQALKAKGMTTATLVVDDQNPTQALKLYEKVGFRVRKKDSIFETEL